MLLLDGFSSDYLEEGLCPCLCNISRENYFSRVKPMFAFQGIGAAIYSGATPNTTGVFAEFVFQRNEIVAESQLFQKLLRITDVIPNDRLCADSRHILFRMAGKNRPGISNVIPSQLLEYFSPKLVREYTEKNSLGHVATIFDTLRASGMSYELQRPATRSENATLNNIASRIEKKEMPDFAVIHPCSLDLVGHAFGPHSPHLRRAVERVDKLMCRIIRSVKRSQEKIIAIILSDHGMSPVNSRINLLKTLDQLPLALGNDYLVFLDSTMARFWFFNEKAEDLISGALNALACGRILREHDLEKLCIDKVGREYGELIFALEDGFAMFPDFFRKHEPPRGMHGYAFPTHDAPILMIRAPNISVGLKRKEAVRFIDVMPTILKIFNLEIPTTCEGVSLLD